MFPLTLICLSRATWTKSPSCSPSSSATTERTSLSLSVSLHFSPSMSCSDDGNITDVNYYYSAYEKINIPRIQDFLATE